MGDCSVQCSVAIRDVSGVHDAMAMGIVQGLGNLCQDSQGVSWGKCCAFFKQGGCGTSIAQWRNGIGIAKLFTEIIERHNMRMALASEGSGFLHKACFKAFLCFC